MANVEENDQGVGHGEMEPTLEQTAAIYAAMMVSYITHSTLQPDDSLGLS